MAEREEGGFSNSRVIQVIRMVFAKVRVKMM
jgi:hypothetical protein